MKKRILICLLILVGAAFLFYLGIQKTHTFTLADREGSSLKGEQIQPVFGTVQVFQQLRYSRSLYRYRNRRDV